MSRPVDAGTMRTQNSPDFIHREPHTWSVREVASWLRQCAPTGLVPSDIEKHNIDGALLLGGLSYEFLNRNVGLQTGLSLIIMRSVRQLREKCIKTPTNIHGLSSSVLSPVQYSAVSDDDDDETSTTTLLSHYNASLKHRPVAARKISLFSACYSGAYASSDSDNLSDVEESRSVPGLPTLAKDDSSTNHSNISSAEYASMEISDEEVATDTAPPDITTEEQQIVETGDAVSENILPAMGTSLAEDNNYTQGVSVQALSPKALATYTDGFGVAKDFALDITHASSLNDLNRENKILVDIDSNLPAEDPHIKDKAGVNIKLEPGVDMAAGDKFMYTEYLEPEKQRQNMLELHVDNAGASADGGVIVISDDELQVFHISPRPEASAGQPSLDIGISSDLVLDTVKVPERPRKRVAPLLVTAKLPGAPSGNIVDQYGSVEPGDDVGPSAPLLSIMEARTRVEELFPYAVSQFRAADWWRVRPEFGSTTLPHAQALEQLGINCDTFWFWRPSNFRIGRAGTHQGHLWDLHLQSFMLQAQAQYRRLIVANDGIVSAPANVADTYDDDKVLPLYGESSDEAELSDGLIREVELERKEIAQRGEKAVETEQRRVAMVKAVIQEMVAHYARVWHEKVQPRLESRAHRLWDNYIERRQALLTELADLRDRRLLKAQQSVIDSGVSKRLQTKVLCGGLRVTVEEIARVTWLLKLIESSRPLPMPRASKSRKNGMAGNATVDNGGLVGGGSSSDDLSDFIDDENDRGCVAQSVGATAQPEIGYSSALPLIRPPVPRLSAGRRRRGLQQANTMVSGRSRRAQNAEICVADTKRHQVLLEECVDIADYTIPDTDSEAADLSDTGHWRQQRPRFKMSSESLIQLLCQYTASEMYKVILHYIHSLAIGDSSMEELAASADGKQKPAIDMKIALRLWAEFQSWIVTALPTVCVRYSSTKMRDDVQAQLVLLMAESGGTVLKVNDSDQRAVSLQLGRIASSIIKCPIEQPPSSSLQADPKPEHSYNTVDIATAELPGILAMLRDGGVAQKTAFVAFYIWRRGTADAADSSKMEMRGTSVSSSSSLANEDFLQDHKLNGSVDSFRSQKRAFSEFGAGNDFEPDFLLASTDDLGELQSSTTLMESEAAKRTRVEKLSKKHSQRRNIKPIRSEAAAVLSLRRQQKIMDRAIQRRLEERAAGLDSDSASTAAEVKNNDDEVLASGNMADPNLPSSMAAVDMADIGTPVLINPGHSAEQQDVMIPGFIAAHLKSHQIDGVRFMWKNIVMISNHSADAASRSEGARRGGLAQHGCVLAHSMGLGKTLQTISLVYTLLNEVHCGNPDFADSIFGARRVLILCPATVQSNWASEFWKWTGVDHSLSRIRKYRALDGPLLPPPLDIPADRNMTMDKHQQLLHTVRALRLHTKRIITQVINYSLMRTSEARLAALRSWNSHGGVLIMGYVGFRELMQYVFSSGTSTFNTVADSSAGEEQNVLQELRRYMVDEGPSLVIADEGHTIKNPQTKLATYANMLSTKARICLTGYPLQNKLEEYWTMVDFCFPNYLGSLVDFRNAYVNPIKNGLYADSTTADKRTSTIRMRTLQKLLESVVDRRDSSILHHQLPRKVEYVISCPLTGIQQELYCRYLAAFLGIGPDGSSSMNISGNEKLFQHGMLLATICNHPAVCRKMLEDHRLQKDKANHHHGSSNLVASECNDSGDMDLLAIEDETLDMADMDLKNTAAVVDDDAAIANIDGALDKAAYADWCSNVFAQHSQQSSLGNGNDDKQIEEIQTPAYSTKVLLMLDIIRQSVKLGERVLVFSRSILTLDYLQFIVESTGVAAGGRTLSGSSTRKTLRIDGTIPVNKRQQLIDQFNSPSSRYFVFFISSGTGSIGINLVSASRVIVFDIGWNPLYDEQAVARVYRYGQKRQVYVYRLLTADTWEERLFNNYIFKVSMSRRVIDKQTMNRQIAKDDMRKYFQRPAKNISPISSDFIANLTQEYRDDFVLATLLAKYSHVLAKVTPQATLLANEDDNLQIEMEVQAMVLREQQRLGLIFTVKDNTGNKLTDSVMDTSDQVELPLANSRVPQEQPQRIPEPSYAPPTLMEVATDAQEHLSEPIYYAGHSGNDVVSTQEVASPGAQDYSVSVSTSGSESKIEIKNHTLLVAEAMLQAVLLRIKGLARIISDNNQTCRVIIGLLQDWLDTILTFIDRISPGAEVRENMPTFQILHMLRNHQVFCDIVPALYHMDDRTLMRMISAGIS